MKNNGLIIRFAFLLISCAACGNDDSGADDDVVTGGKSGSDKNGKTGGEAAATYEEYPETDAAEVDTGAFELDAGQRETNAAEERDVGEATVTISGTVVKTLPGVGMSGTEEPTGEEPIEGVQVCIFERDDIPCVITDSEGKFAFPEAFSQSIDELISFTKEGYPPYLRAVGGGLGFIMMTRIMDDEQMKEVEELFGVTFADDEKGSIVFGAARSNAGNVDSPYTFEYNDLYQISAEGVSVSLEPDEGIGPYYVDDEERYDLSLDATSIAGWGSISNLDPGEYDILFTHPTLQCTNVNPAMNTKVRVVAGYIMNYVSAFCL
ncbi:MAG: hypothetical protein JXA30_18255 [Deltaproteobacteria bacterium]|nr:hypothetical protein [Deltaproteobacteria bacterium]